LISGFKRRAAAVSALLLLVATASGCRVNSVVTIDAGSGGQGRVGVTLTMDQAAVQAIGGRTALTAQLSDADLLAAGWSVTGPTTAPGSTVVITASHPYTTVTEASQLVADLAGSGPASSRPFRVALVHRSDFWHVYTDLSGSADLTCGLGCFGDSGLESSLGSSTGIDPAPLVAQADQTPAQIFGFALDARLPGSIQHSNASSDEGGLLRWTPQIGHDVVISATTEDWNWGDLAPIIAGIGLIVVAFLVAALVLWRSKRRKRKGRDDAAKSGRPSSKRGAHAKRRRGVIKSVTAPS
jgi:hypothetical protein